MNLTRIHLASTPSTNDEGSRWLKAAAPGQALSVWTLRQTAGRGQRGNGWDQVPDQDLAWTLAIKWPAGDADRDPIAFNKAVTAAIRDAIAHLLNTDGCELGIKWPNDLVVRRGDGRWEKCAGVLIENTWKGTRWDGVVVGLGLNVNAPRSADRRRCSLIDVTGRAFDLASIEQLLAERVLEQLSRAFDDASYTNHLVGLGIDQRYTYQGVDGKGTVLGVDEDGSLVLDWSMVGTSSQPIAVHQSNDLEWNWLWD